MVRCATTHLIPERRVNRSSKRVCNWRGLAISRTRRETGIQIASTINSSRTQSASFSASHTLKRSEEHTSELQSLMRLSYAVFCLKKKTTHRNKLQLNKHN